ncbi:MAG: DUF4097 family beta strand repeat-containing protein [Acidobacteriota bacterium]
MPLSRESRRIGWIVLVLLAVAAAGCDIVVSSMENGRVKATEQWTKEFSVSGQDVRFEVANINGRIEISAADEDTIGVTAQISARGVTDEAANETLKSVEIVELVDASRVRLETRYPRERRNQGIVVEYLVTVPRRAGVRVDNVNGEIVLVGIGGGVNADTTNGAIKAKDLGSSVKASVTNGGIDIRMKDLGQSGVSLETTNGSIKLWLPEQAKATLAARVVNGSIRIADLPFEKSGPSSRRRLSGQINGGGPELRLETVNGGITVGRS